MRLQYVRNYTIKQEGKSGAVVVEMEYLPDCSKNYYKLQNGAIKRQVRDWMNQLTFILRALINGTSIVVVAPISVCIDGAFVNKRATPDLHNFMIVTCDAIQNAIGINDQLYATSTGRPGLCKAEEGAKIVVTISFGGYNIQGAPGGGVNA